MAETPCCKGRGPSLIPGQVPRATTWNSCAAVKILHKYCFLNLKKEIHSKEVERRKKEEKERERDRKKEGRGRKEGRLFLWILSAHKSTCHENVSYRTIKIDKKTHRIFPPKIQ